MVCESQERWKYNARLISLWDIMFEYKIGDLAEMLSAALRASRDFNTADQLGQSIATKETISNLSTVLNGLYIMCKNFDADSSLLGQILTLQESLAKGLADTRDSVLHARLEAIISGVQNNLNSRKFMYMPPDQAAYWDKADIFGHEFLASFPVAAILEMREAGNCFAAGRETACVFHCIRVAEYGLRCLAKSLKVKIVDKEKAVPIEYATWNKVIDAIRSKIVTIRKLPVGPRKETELQFYSSAADHCEYIKDIIRNEIAHTRRIYNKQEAIAVISRVREFIIPIAKRRAGKRWWEGGNAKKKTKRLSERR